MAQVSDDGKVVSSGKGRRGLMTAWAKMGTWLRVDLPRQTDRIKAARRGR